MKKLFEKKQVTKSEIDTSYNPYLDAKREWLERYGDYIAQKRNWQILAMLSVLVSLICVIFLGYMGTQNKLVPYIVEVDKLGNTSRVGIVSNTDLKNTNVIKYSINTFITSWRSIWGNIDIQKKFIFDTYNYIEPNSKAFTFVNNEFQTNNPFDKIGKENVKVKIKSIVALNVETWQVEWEENLVSSNGEIIDTTNYKALLQIKQIVPSTEEQIIKNPLGIFISDINYSKIL